MFDATADWKDDMPPIPESHRDLAEEPLTAALATIGPDGTPQVTAVWYVTEGNTVAISVLSTRQKYKNLVARPQATLFVIDPKNPHRTLEVRGTVELGDDPDLTLFAQVARHYGYEPSEVPGPHDDRVVITLRPTRVVALG